MYSLDREADQERLAVDASAATTIASDGEDCLALVRPQVGNRRRMTSWS